MANRYFGLRSRRNAQAEETATDEDERPEAEDDEDEPSAEDAEDEDTDDEDAKPATDARKAERRRVAKITGHKAAAELPTLSGYLAMDTDLSAKVAGGILSAAAEDVGGAPDKSATQESAGEKALARIEAGNPELGDEGDTASKPKLGLASYTEREVKAGRLT